MEPSPRDLLELDIDLRIGADIWSEAMEIDAWSGEQLGAFFMFAYGRGYRDALIESQRGQLCRDHGLSIPSREATDERIA